MHLAAQLGTVVELDIVGYEQGPPSLSTDGGEGGDWLVIRGHFAEGGRSWDFEDACLDTDDASDLGDWLTEVAEGLIEPADAPGFARHTIGFAEPELRLRLAARSADEVEIDVLLLGPAAPDWASGNERGIDGYRVRLVVSVADVRAAAGDWQRQLDLYPCR